MVIKLGYVGRGTLDMARKCLETTRTLPALCFSFLLPTISQSAVRIDRVCVAAAPGSFDNSNSVSAKLQGKAAV